MLTVAASDTHGSLAVGSQLGVYQGDQIILQGYTNILATKQARAHQQKPPAGFSRCTAALAHFLQPLAPCIMVTRLYATLQQIPSSCRSSMRGGEDCMGTCAGGQPAAKGHEEPGHAVCKLGQLQLLGGVLLTQAVAASTTYIG